jgi:hypothetical protein
VVLYTLTDGLRGKDALNRVYKVCLADTAMQDYALSADHIGKGETLVISPMVDFIRRFGEYPLWAVL